MAQRWTIKEDIIICKYCIENPWAYSSDVDVEGMMSRLKKAGCIPRSIASIRKRAYAYEILREGCQRPNIPEQVIIVYETLENNDSNAEKYQSVKSYIREVYNPNDTTEILDGNNSLSYLEGDPNDLVGYQRAIDYNSTFPMVLQKYVDLKGIKKHTSMCKSIGMKPDTFSAILRGKYREVKKENVLRLCIGLKLNLDQAEELLNSAGYMLSNAIMTDVVIKAFLWDRKYSVVAINAELDENNEPMLFENYVIEY